MFSANEGNEHGFTERARRLMADMRANFFPLGIGFYRYCYNEGSLKLLIESLRRRYNENVVLVGHSLGGALAQLVACKMPHYIKSVVTFQSPMANANVVQELYTYVPRDLVEYIELNTWHYRVKGDELIQQAGDYLSPGTVYKMTFRDIEHFSHIEIIYRYLSHVRAIFEGFTLTSNRNVLQTTVERKIVQIEAEIKREPSSRLQSDETYVIEWIRQNIYGLVLATESVARLAPVARIGRIRAARLSTARTVNTDTSNNLLDLVLKMLYVMDWDLNTFRFNDNPLSSQRRIQTLDFTWPIPEHTFRVQRLLSRESRNRFRSQFRKYTYGSAIAS